MNLVKSSPSTSPSAGATRPGSQILGTTSTIRIEEGDSKAPPTNRGTIQVDRQVEAENLRRLRALRGYTLRDLASQLSSVSHAVVHKWERGRAPIPPNLKGKLATILGVQVDCLQRPPPAALRSNFEVRWLSDVDGVLGRAMRAIEAEAQTAVCHRVDFEAARLCLCPYENRLSRAIRTVGGDLDGERLAARFRRNWDLGAVAPIQNLTLAAEDMSIAVTQMADGSIRANQAFALQVGSYPAIVLVNVGTEDQGMVRRLLAEGLFDLMLRKAAMNSGSCDLGFPRARFARAVLMPQGAVEKYLRPGRHNSVTAPMILSLAGVFGLSPRDVVTRLAELRAIDPRQCENFLMTITRALSGFTGEGRRRHLLLGGSEMQPASILQG